MQRGKGCKNSRENWEGNRALTWVAQAKKMPIRIQKSRFLGKKLAFYLCFKYAFLYFYMPL
jgi:hypothetical protein